MRQLETEAKDSGPKASLLGNIGARYQLAILGDLPSPVGRNTHTGQWHTEGGQNQRCSPAWDCARNFLESLQSRRLGLATHTRSSGARDVPAGVAQLLHPPVDMTRCALPPARGREEEQVSSFIHSRDRQHLVGQPRRRLRGHVRQGSATAHSRHVLTEPKARPNSYPPRPQHQPH